MFEKWFFCVVFFVAATKSQNRTTLVKNYLTYQVDENHVYLLTNTTISILHKGSISDLKDAVFLQLFNIHLEEIAPGAFQNLPKVTYLEISFNRELREIKSGIFNNVTNLTKLVVSDNNISVIASNAFDNMTSLKEIVLSNNNLHHWDSDWFFNTPSLNGVFANFNPFSEIPANAFKNLARDETVYIYLAGCDLTRVDDDAFKGVQKIGILSLERNKFETLSGKFLKGVNVDTFKVNDNQIQCQAEDDLDKVFVAKETHIGGNPWDKQCLNKINEWWQHSTKIIVT